MSPIIMFSGGFLLAIIVGMLTGIFGVGGGFLLTPGLMILLGVPAAISVGTGLATFFVNSSFGMFKRRGTGTVDIKIAITIAAGMIVGVMFGSTALEYFEHLPPLFINGREVVAVQFILLCAFLIVLVWVAGFMWSDYRRSGGQAPKERVGLLAKVKLPPYGQFKSLEQPKLSLAALVLLGLFTGFLTGLMGIGGGVVLLPALIYLVGQRTARAAGTSLMLVWCSSFIAVLTNIVNQNINWFLWIALVSGGLTGTYIGTKIGLKVAGPKLRMYFVYVILVAVIMVGYQIVKLIFFGAPVGH
jgi:uncharacterized membrane protein YfcA